MTPTKAKKQEQVAGPVCDSGGLHCSSRIRCNATCLKDAVAQAQKRERSVLGELAGAPAQESVKKRKKAQRAQNRRVSFAPDNQLETTHLFLKVCGLAPR